MLLLLLKHHFDIFDIKTSSVPRHCCCRQFVNRYCLKETDYFILIKVLLSRHQLIFLMLMLFLLLLLLSILINIYCLEKTEGLSGDASDPLGHDAAELSRRLLAHVGHLFHSNKEKHDLVFVYLLCVTILLNSYRCLSTKTYFNTKRHTQVDNLITNSS